MKREDLLEIKKIVLEAIAENNKINNLILEGKIDQKFAENNIMLMEVFSETVDRKIRDAVIPVEVGISDIKGMFRDLLSGQTQTLELTETVEEHDSTIKSNILPRIKILETKVS